MYIRWRETQHDQFRIALHTAEVSRGGAIFVTFCMKLRILASERARHFFSACRMQPLVIKDLHTRFILHTSCMSPMPSLLTTRSNISSASGIGH